MLCRLHPQAPRDLERAYRNCVDFRRIPNELLEDRFAHADDPAAEPGTSNYPTVAVYIPCYNEDVDLVERTVTGALAVDYPPHLLSVYLCDDGQDVAKRDLIVHLRKWHNNVHYIVRPEHTNAKAGNLNYALGRTHSDLVVTLDADFIARPNLLQRLLPYFYVWDPVNERYEFNDQLAAVQTPQHFRNLSPYDHDPLGQRASFFSHIVLPGRDWFNTTQLIGTTNLISRQALEDANFFPTYSVTEDTALSLALYRLGYRIYYTNESLATGLATTSLWSNFDQRERWLKGDFQVLFSRQGPLTAKGLSLVQRIIFASMAFSRMTSIAYIFLDMSVVLFLVFKIPMLDMPSTVEFIRYMYPYFLLMFLTRFTLNLGGEGLGISEAAAQAFEVIFRYTCAKGMLHAVVKGRKIKFKVTDKSCASTKEKLTDVRRRDIIKNLCTTWVNWVVAFTLLFAVGYGIYGPSTMPAHVMRTSFQTSFFGRHTQIVPVAMAYGFAIMDLLPNLLVMYLCFVPYISTWTLKDVVHGRCDQYAVDPRTGKRFVPWSFIVLYSVLQVVLVFGAMGVVVVYEAARLQR